MMKRTRQTLIAMLGLALAGSAFARIHEGDSYFDYARVMNVDRIVEQKDQPVTREECWKEPRDQYHPGTSYRRETEQPLPGSYNTTVVRSEVVDKPGYYTREYEDRCQTHTEYEQGVPQTVAFDVVYRYDGQDYHQRMSRNPGSRVRVHVEDGYVELAE